MQSILLAAAAAAQTFNLTCAGTLTKSSYNGTTSEPYTHEFRVDLDKGKWCESDCRHLFDFADIGPTQLTFEDKHERSVDGESDTSSYVSRETGEYHGLASSRDRTIGPLSLSWKGQCERKPFAGFPTFETKF